ncbi:Fic family protein [Candidatus Micrarchaeota archaeon]|nr:Fic family protein [Candidatus Micrarchaeota archaeon]
MLLDKNIFERILKRKKELEALKPFDQNALHKLQETFRVDLTYNSNAIEGNLLSLNETKLVLEEGITIGGKTLSEHLEATNHAKAIDFLESLALKKQVSELDVLNIHAIILDRINPQNAGFYRIGGVRISGTNYVPPNAAKIPKLMQEVYRLLNAKSGEPIETAAIIHQKFVDIHPFIDGNGRTARLLLNLYLMRNNYPPVILLKAERKKYIRTIMEGQLGKNYAPFVNFVAKAVERSLDIYLDTLGNSQKDYMTLSEAAKISKNHYGEEYLSLLARTGKIGAIKFGRNWKITKEALEDYETDHKNI